MLHSKQSLALRMPLKIESYFPTISEDFNFLFLFFNFFVPQVCVNDHRDIPSHCVTLIIGIWITK